MATTTTKPMGARSHRFRAPPPTPIATGKGLRSAAVDDQVLSEYLDGSLRVPDLTLPGSYYPSRSPLKVRRRLTSHRSYPAMSRLYGGCSRLRLKWERFAWPAGRRRWSRKPGRLLRLVPHCSRRRRRIK
ncbi:unnamed protein product [Musa acuminata subsp. burmannicoides]